MSILGNVFKVAGTVVEGLGKTVVDCVNVIEQERAEYRASEQYTKDKEERERYIKEIKSSLAQIKENSKELVKTYDRKEK
jgi:uncharacterized protein involved in tolerance to divalent cations